ncbi:MAG: DUF1109 family protein [Proteobacteria bacterium]|nr:DUF1109 family protein [Pseudomonadota bacterium]
MSCREDKPSVSVTIDALAAGLEPVRPARPALMYLVCLFAGAVSVACTLSLMGGRADLSERLASGSFLGLAGVLMVASVVTPLLAVRLGFPGRQVNGRLAGGLAALPALLAVAVCLLLPWNPGSDPSTALVGGLSTCSMGIVMAAAVPWLATLVVLASLAPLDAEWAGLLAGLGALFAGALSFHFVCPSTNSFHLATAHYMPLLLAAPAVALPACALFRWITRRRARP